MNVTYTKQVELFLKANSQKAVSLAAQVYTWGKELILPNFLKSVCLQVEDQFKSYLKKKQ